LGFASGRELKAFTRASEYRLDLRAYVDFCGAFYCAGGVGRMGYDLPQFGFKRAAVKSGDRADPFFYLVIQTPNSDAGHDVSFLLTALCYQNEIILSSFLNLSFQRGI
jgi:hypothetical protein